MTSSISSDNKRSAVCEWCKDQPGDYNMSPPDRDYATMICYRCFVENFGEICEGLDSLDA
ncbi:MAG: hypothetical protein ACJ71D_00285 [Nitrososphaera sp.]